MDQSDEGKPAKVEKVTQPERQGPDAYELDILRELNDEEVEGWPLWGAKDIGWLVANGYVSLSEDEQCRYCEITDKGCAAIAQAFDDRTNDSTNSTVA